MRLRRPLILTVLVLAVGCSASTIDEPIPLEHTNGARGFRMFGGVNYTSSVEEARAVVQDKMDEACGGKAQLTRFESTPDLSGPIDIVNFDAVAMCVE
jgi:hypothetical protein